MKSRLIHDDDGQRTYVVILDQGDEVMACLQRFVERERMTAAQVSAIGAFESAVLAYWNWQAREYEEHSVDEQVEALSLLGEVSAEASGKPKLHLHAVLGRRDASTLGGHLMSARVRPTLEVLFTESPAHLRRVHDAAAGLALIKL